tara:strand:+ start:1132 stop:1395 length:264 start_codon:yes stop_codon:yes gene_type:complete
MSTVKSLELAAQCWCDKETESIEMNVPLAEAFAKRLDEQQLVIDELKDFAIWMTGCGYEFTQHEYFNQQRDKLLKTNTDSKLEDAHV